ncbi:MAG: sigma-70 family RNA polymerase sigma factor [Planctomycetota bacterium]
MALSDIDRQLLDRCISGKPSAWQDFVDRFMGLVVHVVNHSAECRSIRLRSTDTEDLVSEVFLAIIANDYAVLRRFRGQSSLATYLTVIARRVVVRQIIRNFTTGELPTDVVDDTGSDTPEQRMSNQEEVHQLLSRLDGPEADVVRMYHLEGKSYGEISQQTGMPPGSVGPTLSRARARLRSGAQPTG